VDSSAMVRMPGNLPWETSFMRLMKSMAWRFSRPPNWLGTIRRVCGSSRGRAWKRQRLREKAVDVVFVEPEEPLEMR